MAKQLRTPVPLHAGMDYTTLVNAMNQNFQTINAQVASTIVINDGTNTRVMLGKLPNGQYGLVVTKPGFNVEDAVS